jgi:hypothetical protein
MGTYRFDDWDARQYDDPSIRLVHPGDVLELDIAPDDGHWTLVEDAPESSEPAGNRGLEASDAAVQTSAPVSGKSDTEAVSTNVDISEQSKENVVKTTDAVIESGD